jgi:hypothetical protein
MAPAFGLAMTVALLLTALPALAQPYDLQMCGEYRAFSLVSLEPAEGVGEITYKWYENDIPIDNSDTASICIAEGRPAGTYAYVRKASSEACPEEAASTPYTVEVLAAPAAPTLIRSAATVCDGTAITFTAAGGSGTYEWSCTGFTCSGDGATQTTPTTAGSYTARVRSVLSSGGATCYSNFTSTVAGLGLSAPTVGQAPNICGGCPPGSSEICGVCLSSQPAAQKAPLCREYLYPYHTVYEDDCRLACEKGCYQYFYPKPVSGAKNECYCCDKFK